MLQQVKQQAETQSLSTAPEHITMLLLSIGHVIIQRLAHRGCVGSPWKEFVALLDLSSLPDEVKTEILGLRNIAAFLED